MSAIIRVLPEGQENFARMLDAIDTANATAKYLTDHGHYIPEPFPGGVPPKKDVDGG